MIRRAAAMLILTSLIQPFVLGGTASATPVAQTEAERQTYGRTFLEPATSVNYIQFGEGGHGEFEGGMELLEELFPRYIEMTTIADELNNPDAVSVGADGLPPWDKLDTGDGLPLHVAIATDRNVPDHNKEYVVLTAGHSGEPCGREGGARFLEDLIIAATETPDASFDNAGGVSGETFEMTAPEILARTKIFFISPSPDGWLVGDGFGETHSQYNGAGINSNRLAYTDGWTFPRDPTLYLRGYTTYSQPEGLSLTHYLRKVREEELNGRPFAVGMDLHGPLPFGFVLLHDEDLDPVKLERMVDLGTRVRQNMEETIPVFGPLDTALDLVLGSLRDGLPDIREIGTLDNDFWRLQGWGRWGFVTHIVDSLGYTVGGSWGGFFASEAGLGAVSLSYEINCRPTSPWVPADQQVYADNVRNVMETGVVTAAAWSRIPIAKVDLGRSVGFYEHGRRVRSADGNPSPVPILTNPIAGRLRQTPYDVSNTDYFRDLRALTGQALAPVTRRGLGRRLPGLDAFVVSDATVKNTAALRRFVESGGDLVLTDSALRMVPALTGIAEDAINSDFAYVGYSDLDRSQPLTQGLLATAWQMFAPTPIGYPLLMERDSYWESGANSDEAGDVSPTKNSAPIFSVDRDAWESAGGTTVGTTDPPADRKAVGEATIDQFGKRNARQDKTEIGILPVGDGRIVIFGALLPLPTERYPHWFGLNAYSISTAGQTMLLRALSGQF
ncbi:MAG TPA: hypothetical protein VNC78_00070 [Actinomycetota bacterium]|nr:hypothetical protein [Actinomycetota bacterium]